MRRAFCPKSSGGGHRDRDLRARRGSRSCRLIECNDGGRFGLVSRVNRMNEPGSVLSDPLCVTQPTPPCIYDAFLPCTISYEIVRIHPEPAKEALKGGLTVSTFWASVVLEGGVHAEPDGVVRISGESGASNNTLGVL